MNKLDLTVVTRQSIARDTVELTLHGFKDINQIKPGQFIHINVGSESNHMLRRPISIADVDQTTGTIVIIFKIIGAGTDLLSKVSVGERLDVLIPCGTGYPIDQISVNHALVIGGGIGVPPLYYLAKQLVARGVRVTSIIGFQTKDAVFYESNFAQLGDCYVVTDDGSYGHKGYVTSIIDKYSIDYFDYFFSCGPTGMLRAVSNQLQDHNGFISIEQRMGCGIGACYACVVPTNDDTNGFKKICKDGPVFRANEVVI
ncbi:dihydroorotate dehydrogenase electron transfer subunit [Aquibacillus salsiterrae]|uniref:dihydroorotate dehydrogenase electron transfer subunit n=1 Tax=Aquibacillus salsiterrae TaxID=2950439 RepID=UPI00234043A4|nr:dihydroorotate dehydrogenase electron transfer subunit [Aquibacillus salsiterrae]